MQYLSLLIVLFALSACQSMYALNQGEQREPKLNAAAEANETQVEEFQLASLDYKTVMANNNVTIYPLDGSVAPYDRRFANSRAMNTNTTAGGYTVSDPSVQVFPIANEPTNRPRYVPDYAVPQYPQPASAQTAGVLTPMTFGGAPAPQAASQPAEPIITRSGQRSRPVLTGYGQGS